MRRGNSSVSEGAEAGPSSSTPFKPLTQANFSAGNLSFADRAEALRVRSVGNGLERLVSIPTYCTQVLSNDEETRVILRSTLSNMALNIELEKAVDEVLGVLDICQWNCKEIPLRDIMQEPLCASLCPYCLRVLIPGYGTHFVIDAGTSPGVSSQKWAIHWVRTRRCKFSQEYQNFVQEKIRELVNSVVSIEEFEENWSLAYSLMMMRGLPEDSKGVSVGQIVN